MNEVSTNVTAGENPTLDSVEVEELPEERAKLTGGKQNFAKGSGNVLPVVLIVIGVIVGVVLLAAVVSMLLKGGLFGASGAASGVEPPPEQAPLNDVQAQRVAQMDW